MTLFPKPLFEWVEPEEFREDQARKAREARKWWHVLAVVAFVDLNLLLFVWAPAHWVPGRHPAPFGLAVLLGAGLGLFLVYGAPWISRWGASTVFIIEGFVVRQRVQIMRVPFKGLSAFSWRKTPLCSVLVLHHRSGSEKQFGVPSEFNQGELTAYLLSRGFDQRRDTDT